MTSSDIRERETKYRAAIETSGDGFCISDMAGRFLEFNDAYVNLTGYSREELLNMSIPDIEAQQTAAEIAATLEKVRCEGHAIFETKHRSKDGRVWPAEVNLSYWPIAGGRMFVFLRDITERKRAEEALRESEERYRSMFLESQAVMLLIDAETGAIKDANLAASSYYGYTKDELTAKLITDINIAPADQVMSGMQRARSGECGQFIFRHRLADGRVQDVEVFSGPIHFHGKILLYSIVHDITARKTAEEALRHRTAELEATNQELESFSYSVAHDLKTPIRAIQGFSRMLLGEHAEKLDAEALRLLKVICTNTEIMVQLIDDLLGLSRLTRKPMRKMELHLDDMARQIFERLKSQAPDRNLQLTVNELPTAYADHSLLYQVMMNLLGNAIKYTKTRETAIIEVGGRTDGNENIYYIKDNGIGFDQRYIDNLFGPFQRLHGLDEYEGTGIGLAIVQRIIQKHGGRVWGESKFGAGATFYFALPKMGIRSAI